MNRFAALDGLRGVSAIAVVLFHLPLAMHAYGSPLVREAYIFVDFFFVLSGFVIAHAYAARIETVASVGDFLLRRVARLWPLHLATLAGLVVLESARFLSTGDAGTRPAFSGETDISLLIPNALLVHNWTSGFQSWNVPSWSISAELLAYIVFGLVVLTARNRMVIAAAAIVAITCIISLMISGNAQLYAGLPMIRAICGFFAGVLVHAVFTGMRQPEWTRRTGTLLELGAIAAIVAFLLLVASHETIPWAMPIFAAAIYVFAAERGAISSMLKSRPLQVLGTLSYSIYLTHMLVIAGFNGLAKVIGKLAGIEVKTPAADLFPEAAAANHIDWLLVHFGNLWANDLFAIALLAVVIGVSALTYRYVEMPGQKLLIGIRSRRQRLTEQMS